MGDNSIQQTENSIIVLKNLLKINNDRIEGYDRVEKLLDNKNHVLINFFNEFKNQSLVFKRDLADLIAKYGGLIEDDKTLDGKLHHFWLKIKDQVIDPTDDEDAAFESIVFGEKAALRAYDYAMKENELPQGVCNLLEAQRQEISRVLHEIEKMKNPPEQMDKEND